MYRLTTLMATALLCATTNANAALSFIDASGTPLAGPTLIDPGKEAVYFTETIDGFGNGRYTVTNNTSNYLLLSFGISNADTFAWMETIGNTFACSADGNSSWCYESSNLNAFNWEDVPIDFDSNTGMDIFGDIMNVLDAGDSTLNFYMAADGALIDGDTWDQFIYSPALLSSQLFVVLEDVSGTIYGFGGQPVPLPPAAILLLPAVISLTRLSRRS